VNNENERIEWSPIRVNREQQQKRRNQTPSMVATQSTAQNPNKKSFGFVSPQKLVPFSKHSASAQQGAQANAGYSASCFLVSRARRGLACRWACQKTKMNECTEAARK
jgi:hypothetical protein